MGSYLGSCSIGGKCDSPCDVCCYGKYRTFFRSESMNYEKKCDRPNSTICNNDALNSYDY